MPYQKWTCNINGVKYKVIKKIVDGIAWLKTTPLNSGYAGVHMWGDLNNPKSVHYEYSTPVLITNYRIGSVPVSSVETYVNASGAIRTVVVPMNSNITSIDTRRLNGSIVITANCSGYVFFINEYP